MPNIIFCSISCQRCCVNNQGYHLKNHALMEEQEYNLNFHIEFLGLQGLDLFTREQKKMYCF